MVPLSACRNFDFSVLSLFPPVIQPELKLPFENLGVEKLDCKTLSFNLLAYLKICYHSVNFGRLTDGYFPPSHSFIVLCVVTKEKDLPCWFLSLCSWRIIKTQPDDEVQQSCFTCCLLMLSFSYICATLTVILIQKSHVFSLETTEITQLLRHNVCNKQCLETAGS